MFAAILDPRFLWDKLEVLILESSGDENGLPRKWFPEKSCLCEKALTNNVFYSLPCEDEHWYNVIQQKFLPCVVNYLIDRCAKKMSNTMVANNKFF